MSDPTSTALAAAGDGIATSSPATPATDATPATPGPADAMSRAVQDLMAQKGMQSTPPEAQPETPSPKVPEEPTPATPEADPQTPAEPTLAVPKDIREAMDRVARKDALYQQERNRARQLEQQMADLKKQQDEFYSRLSADPLAVMREKGVRFSDIAVRALTGKDEPKPDAKPAALPPELQQEFEDLKKFRNEYREQQQRSQQTDQRNHAIGLVKGVLEKDTQIPLVNELGKYGDVLDLVQKHVGHHGEFADDREAEEVVAFYARQVEQAERRTILSYASKPGVKTWLAKELGLASSTPQREAPPARPEIQGDPRETNPRPALSNNLTSQRSVVSPPQAWDYDTALRQAAAEMQANFNAGRADR